MNKELIFLGIMQWKEPHNFLVPPERLIRIPVNAKTTCHAVYLELKDTFEGLPAEEQALDYYRKLVGHVHYKELFFKQQFYHPEPDEVVYAMFNLKTV